VKYFIQNFAVVNLRKENLQEQDIKQVCNYNERNIALQVKWGIKNSIVIKPKKSIGCIYKKINNGKQ